MTNQPIGVFDSGYGGLTILKEMVAEMPQYDYLYLGDNARAPYGDKSFDVVYDYTKEAMQWFFSQGCNLVILACNTASAKALRSIQQEDLPKLLDPNKRVLGVIRPTTEVIGELSKSGHVGVLGTNGTVQSGSYVIEIAKFFPTIKVTQEACPEWVSLVEENRCDSEDAHHYVQLHIKHIMNQDPQIDTLLLACTHYPLLMDTIKAHTPNGVQIITQGQIVAKSLGQYLKKHANIEKQCSKQGKTIFYTTGDCNDFNSHASLFFGKTVSAYTLVI